MEEIISQLETIQAKLKNIETDLNLAQKKTTIETLEAKTNQVDFWQKETEAKDTMKQIADLRDDVTSFEVLNQSVQEQLDLANMSLAELDSDLKNDLQINLKKLQKSLQNLELQVFLNGEYDNNNAILSIHSGQGGIEAMDWAEMLLRMYCRYCESHQFTYELIQQSRGEEAGIKAAVILIKGKNAYGFLKNEQGTHRLVRLSPFIADNLRQTSFALVEVLPEIVNDPHIELKEDELEWQFFRSSGKGGQNVNKVSTAVRLTHLPTQTIVEAQAERTQVQNRQLALSLLTAKIWERRRQEQEKTIENIKGEHKQASFGNQIRSYILHPYHLVKDLRTQIETSNTKAVLDGDLDLFIDAEIRLNQR